MSGWWLPIVIVVGVMPGADAVRAALALELVLVPVLVPVVVTGAAGAGVAGAGGEGHCYGSGGGEEFPPAVRGHQAVRYLTRRADRRGHSGQLGPDRVGGQVPGERRPGEDDDARHRAGHGGPARRAGQRHRQPAGHRGGEHDKQGGAGKRPGDARGHQARGGEQQTRGGDQADREGAPGRDCPAGGEPGARTDDRAGDGGQGERGAVSALCRADGR